jgi:arginase
VNGPAIDLVIVPYDSGRRGWRMGAGPLALIEAGIATRLRDLGLDVRVVDVELPEASRGDQRAAFELGALVQREVHRARVERRFPLVLAGNCASSLGTVAGMRASAGVVWFDAHGDFNTPETSTSGFLDGTSLAILTGRCNRDEVARIPDFRAVPEDAVALVGARELDDAERALLEASAIRHVPVGAATSETLAAAIESWPESASEAYLHVDLDVLDASEATVNEYAAAGGLALPDLMACIDAVAAHVPIGAAAITALDPGADAAGRAIAAAIAVIEQIVARVEPGVG